MSAHEYQYGDLLLGPAGRGEVLDATTLFATVRWEDGREEEVDQFTPRIVVDVRGIHRPGVWYACAHCGKAELQRDADPKDWNQGVFGDLCVSCLEEIR